MDPFTIIHQIVKSRVMGLPEATSALHREHPPQHERSAEWCVQMADVLAANLIACVLCAQLGDKRGNDEGVIKCGVVV